MKHMNYRLKMTIYCIRREVRPVYWRLKRVLKDLIYRRKARKFLEELLERFPDEPNYFYMYTLVGKYGIKPSTAMKYIKQIRQE